MLLLASCGPTKRYRPVVKYAHPSSGALQRILRTTYGDSYRYAGQGPNRFDCSGLVYYSFATMNLWLPRTAADQSRRGKTVPVEALKYGDLIFFDTRPRYRGKVNHVGIYIGGGRFLHASSTKRRVVSGSIRTPFWRKRIIVCKRLIPGREPAVYRQADISHKHQPAQTAPTISTLVEANQSIQTGPNGQTLF
jgi:hypothetical protein